MLFAPKLFLDRGEQHRTLLGQRFGLLFASAGAVDQHTFLFTVQAGFSSLTVMHVGGRACNRRHRAAIRINPDVRCHSDVPMAVFVCAAHFAIACLVVVLGARWGVDGGFVWKLSFDQGSDRQSVEWPCRTGLVPFPSRRNQAKCNMVTRGVGGCLPFAAVLRRVLLNHASPLFNRDNPFHLCKQSFLLGGLAIGEMIQFGKGPLFHGEHHYRLSQHFTRSPCRHQARSQAWRGFSVRLVVP